MSLLCSTVSGGTIPFASIRIYEGTPQKVNEVLGTYDIVKGEGFAGHVSMELGVFYKRTYKWKFNAVGEPTKDKRLEETIKTVAQNYL
jgi:tellurium resistance protein TerZ